MVRAVVRPDRADAVADALAAAGFTGMTRTAVVGRGRQQGIMSGGRRYDELPKAMIMVVVDDDDVATVTETVIRTARTGDFGDGKVFVSPVEAAWTVRTGTQGL